jgi:hypothetical protein
MTYRGTVKNGVVVLGEGATLDEGTEVQVEPIGDLHKDRRPAIYDRLAKLAGNAKGLPADLARQHDHYLHGQAKR